MARITRSAASTSWIDQHQQVRFPSPALGMTLPILESDDESDANYIDSASVSREFLLGEQAYRFANFVEGYIEVTNGVITRHGWTEDSKIYRSPSFAALPSIEYESSQIIVFSAQEVTFKQLVGCRTRSPELLSLPFGIGGLAMSEAATSFPPIWTEVALTIRADGSTSAQLLRHSIFPSNCLFLLNESSQTYTRSSYYNAWAGSTSTLEDWYENGWGEPRDNGGNPWCIPNPGGLDFFTRGGDILSIDPVESQCEVPAAGVNSNRQGASWSPSSRGPRRI